MGPTMETHSKNQFGQSGDEKNLMMELGSKQALEFSLCLAETFKSLLEVLSSRLNIRWLLQELAGSLGTIRTSDLQSVYEGSANPTIPIQPAE